MRSQPSSPDDVEATDSYDPLVSRRASPYPGCMSEAPQDPSVEIVDAPDQGRFELRLDGALVSFVDYADLDGRRAFPHTQTYPEFGGRGFGTQVVRAALDEAVASGRSIVPSCPFVRAIVDQHPDEYGALVA